MSTRGNKGPTNDDSQASKETKEHKRGRWTCKDMEPRMTPANKCPLSKRTACRDSCLNADYSVLEVKQSSVDREIHSTHELNSSDVDASPIRRMLFNTQKRFTFFDSNENASLRKKKSRRTVSGNGEESESAPSEASECDESSGPRTEIVALTIIACIVLFPYLVLWWTSPVSHWPALQMLWSVLFQSIAVAFLAGLLLNGLQGFLHSGTRQEDSEEAVDPGVKDGNCDDAEIAEIGGGDNEATDVKAETELEIKSVNTVTTQTECPQDGCLRIAKRDKQSKNAVKRMYRKYLHFRRKCRSDLAGLRRNDSAANEFLARLQLAMPGLDREKQVLLAELEAIEKQYEEEKRRNHDLVIRLHRLNQHFLRIGQPTQHQTHPQALGPGRQPTQQHVQPSQGASQKQSPYPAMYTGSSLLAPFMSIPRQRPIQASAHVLQAPSILQLPAPRQHQQFHTLQTLSPSLTPPSCQAVQQIQ